LYKYYGDAIMKINFFIKYYGDAIKH